LTPSFSASECCAFWSKKFFDHHLNSSLKHHQYICLGISELRNAQVWSPLPNFLPSTTIGNITKIQFYSETIYPYKSVTNKSTHPQLPLTAHLLASRSNPEIHDSTLNKFIHSSLSHHQEKTIFKKNIQALELMSKHSTTPYGARLEVTFEYVADMSDHPTRTEEEDDGDELSLLHKVDIPIMMEEVQQDHYLIKDHFQTIYCRPSNPILFIKTLDITQYLTAYFSLLQSHISSYGHTLLIQPSTPSLSQIGILYCMEKLQHWIWRGPIRGLEMAYFHQTGLWDSITSRNIPWIASSLLNFSPPSVVELSLGSAATTPAPPQSKTFLKDATNSITTNFKVKNSIISWWKEAEEILEIFSDIERFSAMIFHRFYVWLCSEIELDKHLMEAFQKALSFEISSSSPTIAVKSSSLKDLEAVLHQTLNIHWSNPRFLELASSFTTTKEELTILHGKSMTPSVTGDYILRISSKVWDKEDGIISRYDQVCGDPSHTSRLKLMLGRACINAGIKAVPRVMEDDFLPDLSCWFTISSSDDEKRQEDHDDLSLSFSEMLVSFPPQASNVAQHSLLPKKKKTPLPSAITFVSIPQRLGEDPSISEVDNLLAKQINKLLETHLSLLPKREKTMFMVNPANVTPLKRDLLERINKMPCPKKHLRPIYGFWILFKIAYDIHNVKLKPAYHAANNLVTNKKIKNSIFKDHFEDWFVFTSKSNGVTKMIPRGSIMNAFKT